MGKFRNSEKLPLKTFGSESENEKLQDINYYGNRGGFKSPNQKLMRKSPFYRTDQRHSKPLIFEPVIEQNQIPLETYSKHQEIFEESPTHGLLRENTLEMTPENQFHHCSKFPNDFNNQNLKSSPNDQLIFNSHSSRNRADSGSIKFSKQRNQNHFQQNVLNNLEKDLTKPKNKFEKRKMGKKLMVDFDIMGKNDDETNQCIPTQSFKRLKTTNRHRNRFFENRESMNSKKTMLMKRDDSESIKKFKIRLPRNANNIQNMNTIGASQEAMNSVLLRINSHNDVDVETGPSEPLEIVFKLENEQLVGSVVKNEGREGVFEKPGEMIRDNLEILNNRKKRLTKFDFGKITRPNLNKWRVSGQQKAPLFFPVMKNEIPAGTFASKLESENVTKVPQLGANAVFPAQLLKGVPISRKNQKSGLKPVQSIKPATAINADNLEQNTQFTESFTHLGRSGFVRSYINSKTEINMSLKCGSIASRLNLNNSLLGPQSNLRMNFSQKINRGKNQMSGTKKESQGGQFNALKSNFGLEINAINLAKTSLCDLMDIPEKKVDTSEYMRCHSIDENLDDQHGSSYSLSRRGNMSGQNALEIALGNPRNSHLQKQSKIQENNEKVVKDVDLKTEYLGKRAKDWKEEIRQRGPQVVVSRVPTSEEIGGGRQKQGVGCLQGQIANERNIWTLPSHKVISELGEMSRPLNPLPKPALNSSNVNNPFPENLRDHRIDHPMPSDISFIGRPSNLNFREASPPKDSHPNNIPRNDSLSRSSKWKLFNDASKSIQKSDSMFSYKKMKSTSNRQIEKLQNQPKLQKYFMGNVRESMLSGADVFPAVFECNRKSESLQEGHQP